MGHVKCEEVQGDSEGLRGILEVEVEGEVVHTGVPAVARSD